MNEAKPTYCSTGASLKCETKDEAEMGWAAIRRVWGLRVPVENSQIPACASLSEEACGATTLQHDSLCVSTIVAQHHESVPL